MARFPPIGLLAVLMAAPVQVPVSQRDQPQQQPAVRRVAVGTASIAGTVTAADSGRPIRGARVSVNGTIVSVASRAAMSPAQLQSVYASRAAVTDDQGNFIIDKLPAGQYTLNVSGPRNTFLPFTYGQKKANGTQPMFPLADGQRVKLNVPMIRGGVIVGTVFDENGDPLTNSQIRSWRYMMSGGVRRLQSTGLATTDDRGMYRLFGLQPGDYLVSATPDSSGLQSFGNPDDALIEQAIASGAVTPPAGPGLPATVAIPVRSPQQIVEQRQMDGPPPGYLPVFYPSSAIPTGATVVRIDGGEERIGIDIQVRFVQATNIQGTIENPPGEGLGVQLSLVSDDPALENTGASSSRPDNTGHFTFRNVAPGKYTIVAQTIVAQTITIVNGFSPPTAQPPRQLDESERWWGRTVVSVNGQQPTLTASVALKPGRSITGRVVFEMEQPPDLTRQKLIVTLSQAPGFQSGMFSTPPQAEVAPDGSFALKGVVPGKYILRAPAGIAKSSMINGRDVLDFPLDFTGERDLEGAVLTATDRFTEVSGTLTDGAGKPATDFMILAAAADPRFWVLGSRRILIARPSPDGVYMLRNLPPGEYLLAGVTNLENGAQYDPEFLKSLSTAPVMHVTVVEGGKISQDLRVVR